MQKFELLKKFDIIRDDTNLLGRHYSIIDCGVSYPSVTNVISKMLDKSGIGHWRQLIGEKEADKIVELSSWRGDQLHKALENYLLGKLDQRKLNPIVKEVFVKIRDILDRYVTEIHGMELPVYSHILKTAGSADLVCKFGKYKTVADFKNSRSVKEREDIKGYFIQATAYGLCLNEMYGYNTELIAILIATDGIQKCVTYIEPFKKHLEETKELFFEYRRRRNDEML